MKNDWLPLFGIGVIVIIIYLVFKNQTTAAATAPAGVSPANAALSGSLLDQAGTALASLLGGTAQGAANIGNSLGLGTSTANLNSALNLGSYISNAGQNPGAPEQEGGDFLNATSPAILNTNDDGAVDVGASQAALGLDGI